MFIKILLFIAYDSVVGLIYFCIPVKFNCFFSQSPTGLIILLLLLMHLYEIQIKSNKIQARNRNLINFAQERKSPFLKFRPFALTK
jgi:hypothetical protein